MEGVLLVPIRASLFAIAIGFVGDAAAVADEASPADRVKTSDFSIEYTTGIDVGAFHLAVGDDPQTSIRFRQYHYTDNGRVTFGGRARSGDDSLDLTLGYRTDWQGVRWEAETGFFSQLLDEENVGAAKLGISRKTDLGNHRSIGWRLETEFVDIDDLNSISASLNYSWEWDNLTLTPSFGFGADPSDLSDGYSRLELSTTYEFTPSVSLQMRYRNNDGEEEQGMIRIVATTFWLRPRS